MTLISERKKKWYPSEDLEGLHKVPKHLALIMDGNRRWARAHSMPIQMGYAKGAENLRVIVEAAIELGIQTMTVYSFSTENVNRSPAEIKVLYALFKKYLKSELSQMIENEVRFETIGDLSHFPKDIRAQIENAKRETKKNNRFTLVLALNYGARDEMRRAVQKMIGDSKNQPSFEVTEDVISHYLDTANFPDPDLLIRTSGERRLSNFLLWQISYTEIYFSQVLWPDFSPMELLKAIKCYQNRTIRRGK